MKRSRLLSLALVAALLGLILTACLSRGSRPEPGQAPAAAITIEVARLNTPAFEAPRVPPATPAAAAPPAAHPAAPTPAAATSDSPTPDAPASPTSQPAAPATAAGDRRAATDFSSEAPAAWFELAYQVVRDEKLPPPLAARLFGYAGVTLYEAVAPGIPGSTSLAGQLNELQSLPQPNPQAEYHWPAVANAALATLVRALAGDATSETLGAIAGLERQLKDRYAREAAPDVLQRSIEQGQLVGLTIFDWAQADGYAYLTGCQYTSPAGPSLWEPTAPGFAAPLQPCWGQMRPFVLRERSDECQPGAAPVYSEDPTSQFYFEALEVYLTVKNLTPQQQEIARYWSDDAGVTGTPPGHAIAILTQIIRDRELSLDAASEAYARLGIALADSFISCWQTKFATNVVRPITYIRKLMDENWSPPVTTPPFPEYTSGHSVQSGATAAVLTAIFGDTFAFTDHTHDALGYAPRTFASFYEMANEAAISRLYGGIHYRSAIDVGIDQGKCIGQRVNSLYLHRQAP